MGNGKGKGKCAQYKKNLNKLKNAWMGTFSPLSLKKNTMLAFLISQIIMNTYSVKHIHKK